MYCTLATLSAYPSAQVSNDGPRWEFMEERELAKPREFIGDVKFYRVEGINGDALNLERMRTGNDENDNRNEINRLLRK